jgi:hypothetical protein
MKCDSKPYRHRNGYREDDLVRTGKPLKRVSQSIMREMRHCRCSTGHNDLRFGEKLRADGRSSGEYVEGEILITGSDPKDSL